MQQQKGIIQGTTRTLLLTKSFLQLMENVKLVANTRNTKPLSIKPSVHKGCTVRDFINHLNTFRRLNLILHSHAYVYKKYRKKVCPLLQEYMIK